MPTANVRTLRRSRTRSHRRRSTSPPRERNRTMPFIRVNCPKGALTAEQKAELAPRLVHALIRQEIDPVTEIGTAATGFFFNEVDVENCFPGGVPLTEHPDKMFWTVEAFVAASYFSQERRDEMQ